VQGWFLIILFPDEIYFHLHMNIGDAAGGWF
jgi:hypothetical protein